MTNIAFFGTSRFAQIVLEKLVNSPFAPTLVITAPDTKVGRGQKLAPSPVKQTAARKGLRIMQPHKLSETSGQLKDSNIAILVAYGKIIPKEILAIPKYGFINVHPSLLPKYRGPSPIQTAILAGEEKTGISIMVLDVKVDHGPILAQKEVLIEKDDTHSSLVEKLAPIGAALLIETLPYYLDGAIYPQPQNHGEATFTKHIAKQDGFVDLKNPPKAQALDRMIRAFYPWPGTWYQLTVNGRQLTVKFLPGNAIQPEGKRPMSISEFRNGYPQAYDLIKHLFPVQSESKNF